VLRAGEDKAREFPMTKRDGAWTVSATPEGKPADTRVEVSARLPTGTVGFTPADPSAVTIAPPVLTEDKVVKRLPDAFSDVVPGGGGRYLIFHLPRLKKLAVFDVAEARVSRYIPLTEDKVFFAAGRDAVIIGLPKANRLERGA